MQKFTLLVGNGINNIEKDNSWENLIKEIGQFCKIGFAIDDEKKKQFPLLYEEIFLSSARDCNIRENDLKKFIAEKVSVIKSNVLHDAIRALPIDDIITTNYEFSLEGTMPEKNEGIVGEKLYSIFRHYTVDKKRVWHIHGDCLYPNSINLGFEHYGGQLQNIRNYVATGTSYASKKASRLPLMKRLETGHLNGASWIDLFFTTHLHIIGLTFGFVETDLWWLLTYRARMKIRDKKLVQNQISYYIPERFAAASKHKLDLFKATDVNVVVIAKDDEAYYRHIFEKITNR
ncbi:SIR2 family protein [Chryseolinea lacunae]|uniref:SIR2-like domain-containing protein n=1 Tax=Chryseolinea lacunae TaxID=2801331 RepID=A0ABS1KNK8_9BACT|nr:SIR2 family protein [Chryseolinea lacunae]MBL0740272.1 hypothetical protein [Chryseolinea lacunae]